MTDAGSPEESTISEETRRILADLKRVRDRPAPTDPRSAGYLTAIVAVAGLVSLRFIAPGPLSGAATIVIGVGLAVIAVLGVLLGFLGGVFVRGAVAADVGKAIDELLAKHPHGDRVTMRQAAIRILDGASVSTGPATVETFDVREVAARLGDVRPSSNGSNAFC